MIRTDYTVLTVGVFVLDGEVLVLVFQPARLLPLITFTTHAAITYTKAVLFSVVSVCGCVCLFACQHDNS